MPKVRAPWGKKDEKSCKNAVADFTHIAFLLRKEKQIQPCLFFAPDKTVFHPILLRENEKWSGYIKKVELNSAPLPKSVPASVSFSFFEPTVSDPELANLAVLLRSRKVGFPKKEKRKKRRSLSHFRFRSKRVTSEPEQHFPMQAVKFKSKLN